MPSAPTALFSRPGSSPARSSVRPLLHPLERGSLIMATVYDLAKKSLKLTQWVFHTARVQTIAWTDDSKHAASGSLDPSVYVWSVEKPMRNVALKASPFTFWRCASDVVPPERSSRRDRACRLAGRDCVDVGRRRRRHPELEDHASCLSCTLPCKASRYPGPVRLSRGHLPRRDRILCRSSFSTSENYHSPFPVATTSAGPRINSFCRRSLLRDVGGKATPSTRAS